MSEVTQSCLTLCDPMDCSLPGSSVHGIFQARILEWVAISFSRGSSRPRDWTRVSRIVGRRFTVWATRDISCICATNIVLEVFTHLFLHIKCFHSLKQQLKATTKRWKLGTSIYMIVNLFLLFLQSLYFQIISVFIIDDNFRACHAHLLNHNFFFFLPCLK